MKSPSVGASITAISSSLMRLPPILVPGAAPSSGAARATRAAAPVARAPDRPPQTPNGGLGAHGVAGRAVDVDRGSLGQERAAGALRSPRARLQRGGPVARRRPGGGRRGAGPDAHTRRRAARVPAGPWDETGVEAVGV